MITDRQYQILKWIAAAGLPAAGTAIFAVGQIWGIPYIPEIVGTVIAFNTMLGAFLGVEAADYGTRDRKYDGTVSLKDILTVDSHILDIPNAGATEYNPSEVLLRVKD